MCRQKTDNPESISFESFFHFFIPKEVKLHYAKCHMLWAGFLYLNAALNTRLGMLEQPLTFVSSSPFFLFQHSDFIGTRRAAVHSWRTVLNH